MTEFAPAQQSARPEPCVGRLAGLSAEHFNGHVCYALAPSTSTPADGDALLAVAPGFELNDHFERDAASGRVPVHVQGAPKPLSVRVQNIVPIRSEPGEAVLSFRNASEQIIRALLLNIPALGDTEVLVDVIVDQLRIARVDSSSVEAISASSTDDSQPDVCHRNNALRPDEDNWWISAAGTCPGGVGREHVTFRCGATSAPVRVDRVALKIPPLPMGPLSVREFHLESANSPEGPWTRATPDLQTLDSRALQEWALHPPLESRYVRIVCTKNATANRTRIAGCVGFFYIKFT